MFSLAACDRIEIRLLLVSGNRKVSAARSLRASRAGALTRLPASHRLPATRKQVKPELVRSAGAHCFDCARPGPAFGASAWKRYCRCNLIHFCCSLKPPAAVVMAAERESIGCEPPSEQVAQRTIHLSASGRKATPRDSPPPDGSDAHCRPTFRREGHANDPMGSGSGRAATAYRRRRDWARPREARLLPVTRAGRGRRSLAASGQRQRPRRTL